MLKHVAEKLDLVQKELEPLGLGLKVWDGFRPYSVAKKMWEIFPIDSLVADPAKGSNHCRGTAVDLTLINLKDGSELEMPTPFDELSKRAHRNYTKDLSMQAIQNRQLLEDVMVKYDFIPLPTEWWHFANKDSQSYPVLDIKLEELK